MRADVVVYGPELAPFVDKVLRALRLKKLDHALVEPRGPEDYRRWSPETGLLPVVDLGGVRIADSARILDALDARWPEPPLLSGDPKAAEQQRRLEAWAGETFFYYWQRYLRRRTEEAASAAAEEPPSGLLARLGIFGRGERSPADERYDAEFGRCIEDVARFLGTRPWFYGERIGRADLAVFGFLRHVRAGMVPGHEWIDRHPALVDWYERTDEATGPPAHRA